MARGGKRAGAGRKAGGEAMVAIRVPESLVPEAEALLKAKNPEGSVVVLEGRKRRRSGDRRPESKASICNVRMSPAEQECLKTEARRAGYGSLQDFLYALIKPIVDRVSGSRGTSEAASETAAA